MRGNLLTALQKAWLPVAALFATLLGVDLSRNGEVLCVANAANLQKAISTAASHGKIAQVYLVRGTYVRDFDYPAATEQGALTRQGEYKQG
jgi:hypothetical protein